MPTFSLIIPTHNRADLLPEAIESVLGQQAADLELIVVDDGSTDDTGTVAAAYTRDRRVRYVQQAKAGRSMARNLGVQLARGEWLGFLDSDDRYLPHALTEHRRVHSGPGQPALTLAGYEYIDAAGQTIGERRPWEEAPLTLAGWLFNCLSMPGAMLVRRTWFERLGGFDPACEIAEDWDLCLRLAYAGCPMAWVTASACQYRQHGGNSINSLAQHCQGSLRTLDKLFAQPDLPADVLAEADRARAWVHVVFARRAFLAHNSQAGRDHLQLAAEAFPAYANSRRGEVVEAVLSAEWAPPGASQPVQTEAALALAQTLGATAADLRQARARVEMARFFRLARSSTPHKARPYLAAGLRLDPRWLANRGVLSFLVRQALRA